MSSELHEHAQTHTVRPRWTWIALVMMVAGLVLIGVGIVVQSWACAIPGLVLLVVGGVLGLYGGFFYDVQGGSALTEQMRDVKENNEFEFPDATTKHTEDEIKQDVHRRWLHEGE